MRRAIVVTLAGLAACWCVWAVGRIAVTEQTAELPASETHLTQGAQERLAEASTAVQAARAQQVKPEPVTYRTTIKPPRAVMAAKSACELSTAWKFSLNFPHAGTHLVSGMQNSGLSGSGMGVAGRLMTIGGEDAAPHEHEGDEWRGIYLMVRVELDAPGLVNNSKAFSLWLRDVSGPPFPYPAPTYPVITSLPATEFTCALSGVYLHSERTHNPPADRSLMDPTDSAYTETWVAEEGATASISALCPDGSTISASGALGDAGGGCDIGSDYGITFAFTIQGMPTVGVVEGIASGIAWDATSIDGGTVELYNPGDDAPDGDNPNWGRTKTTTDCKRVTIAGSSISMWREGGANTLTAWDGHIWAPYIVTFTPVDGKFDASGPAYAIEYSSNAVTYTDVSTYTVDTFDDVYGPVVHAAKSWLLPWEYTRLSSTAIQVRETTAWRTLNNEDVGDSTETQNDARAHLCMWGLQATSRTQEPYWLSGFGFALPASIDINDTQGLPSRASPWVGGTGVTVDPGDNDLWTVAAGVSSPAVSRTMATRYWLRMDRLASGYTPGLEYHQDWPIMLKANLPILTTEDDPDWWTLVTSEDITNWANRRYVLLGINAPRAGNVTLTVAYSVPHPDDPCYTCAEHRWGEWSYTRSQYTVTYTVPVEAGANSCLVDLYENNEAAYVRGEFRMQVVDSLSLALPANTSETPENWTLTGLALVLDPGTATRDEPATHYAFRFRPSWAWIGTYWFGFGGWVDGHDVLEVEYGYSSQQYEMKLAYIAHSAHCPDSELTTRLDSAKALGRLYNELSWQEGFTPSWPSTSPENNSNNKDADGNYVDSSLYWWDLHQSTEAWTISNLDVALVAGTYNIAAGVAYNIRFPKFPRGRLHGLSMSSSWEVQRLTAGVTIYSLSDAGAWSLTETLTTDEHGRYQTSPFLELGAGYKIANKSNVKYVANREYTSDWARVPELRSGGILVGTTRMPCTETELVARIQGDNLDVIELDDDSVSPAVTKLLCTVDTSGGYDSPCIEHSGAKLSLWARKIADDSLYRWTSTNYGSTWTGPVAAEPT